MADNQTKTAYVCGPLTELPPETQAQVKTFYERIGDLHGELFGRRAFVPHEYYDPIKHAHFTPQDVIAPNGGRSASSPASSSLRPSSPHGAAASKWKWPTAAAYPSWCWSPRTKRFHVSCAETRQLPGSWSTKVTTTP